jgi:hypothetical protein
VIVTSYPVYHYYHHGGPPPWAPAHGYWRKHDSYRAYGWRRY